MDCVGGGWGLILPHQCSSLLRSRSADARPPGDVIAFEGATSWSTFPAIEGTTQFDGVWIGRVSNPVFYCTVNGVGAAEDGFYVFYLTGSAVYQPAVDDTKWKMLPVHGNGNGRNIRSAGATAVVGSKVYLIGGLAKSASTDTKYSVLVDVFDTSAGKFSAGVPMTTGRIGHSAAAYDGKIYVFGGRSAANVVLSVVESFDIATKKWSTKTPMPEASRNPLSNRKSARGHWWIPSF